MQGYYQIGLNRPFQKIVNKISDKIKCVIIREIDMLPHLYVCLQK